MRSFQRLRLAVERAGELVEALAAVQAQAHSVCPMHLAQLAQEQPTLLGRLACQPLVATRALPTTRPAAALFNCGLRPPVAQWARHCQRPARLPMQKQRRQTLKIQALTPKLPTRVKALPMMQKIQSQMQKRWAPTANLSPMNLSSLRPNR